MTTILLRYEIWSHFEFYFFVLVYYTII